MKAIRLLSLFLLVACQDVQRPVDTQPIPAREDLFVLAKTDLKAFAEQVGGTDSAAYEQAENIVTWFAENFDWSATDYKRRTVQEILERGGGNCNELAAVTIASLDELGLRMRKVREINLHTESDRRQQTAEEKVRTSGPRMSVFGKRHNDHVWIEIYDEDADFWFPADPSLGVVGEEMWLEARLGFGERYTLDPTSADMIAPFAIFAVSDSGTVVENRTGHYAVDGFDRLYADRLSRLDAWEEWEELLDLLDDKASGAFAGVTNLHEFEPDIHRLSIVYDRLRSEYRDTYGEFSPPR